MANHTLRKDTTCLNCGHTVTDRYCGQCGQENIEPRQTFGHLMAHFFEDLTHYEGKFWGTLLLLFFKPAYLTKEFVVGKRAKYLPPVRLYIFASFLTFLVPAIIPRPQSEEPPRNKVEASEVASVKDSVMHIVGQKMVENGNRLDSIGRAMNQGEAGEITYNDGKVQIECEFNSVAELDSVRAARMGTDAEIDWFSYIYYKRLIMYKEKYNAEVFTEMLWRSIVRNIPKALFIYMPIFALMLGLVHKRKNWLFFDHGIFTLHYFSFMLLAYLIYVLISSTVSWTVFAAPGLHFLETFSKVLMVGLILWIPYYLYRGHHLMYQERRMVSALKVSFLLLLNSIILFCICMVLLFVSFLLIH